ncbi:MAG: universal stress protein [Syntrophales bacterium]|jgi:nucleotide-binding universal stress UspA family protein|nr:universal stress protein [Syntrophales bacterium]MDY0044375.1 universal stress protein [Syntrophales bacterium]
MYRFRNLIVGMTVGEQDRAKIQYAGLVTWLAMSQAVTFTHVLSFAELSEKTKPLAILLSDCRNAMEELVRKYYDGHPDTEIFYEVIPESPLVEIELLRRFKEIDVDLVVIGKIRGEFTSQETLPVKLTRKAPGSVLYIPEEAVPSRKHPEDIEILVPVDFLENAHDALELAVDFAAAHEITSVRCVHIYDVPLGYYKRGKSYAEFSSIMESNAEKKIKDFIGEIDLKGVFVKPMILRHDKKIYEIIDEVVKVHGIDLIIIGSRRKNAAARFLLDSVTEQLIRTTAIPLLAARRKGKGMTFLDALLKI